MKRFLRAFLWLALSATLFAAAAADRTSVFVLTDIEKEPDDAMSLVRFLTYANHFEIEGVVATTSAPGVAGPILPQQPRVQCQR